MQGMGGDKCPFTFNTKPDTFKVGDSVSYRVPSMGDFPFAALIKAVYDDYIEIADYGDPEKIVRATREENPVVSDEEALS